MRTVVDGLLIVVAIVIGSIVVEETVTRIGDIYNATNPVIQAQKQALAYLESSGLEFEEMIARNERLTAEARERQFGRQYAIKLQAQIAKHTRQF
jgi:hypothetical protein